MNENFATLWESLVDAHARPRGRRVRRPPDHVRGVRRPGGPAGDRTRRARCRPGRHRRALPLQRPRVPRAACTPRSSSVPSRSTSTTGTWTTSCVYLLADSAAKVLVFHGSLGERVGAVRERAPGLSACVQVDDGAPARGRARWPTRTLIAGHEPAPRVARSGDDRFILYTGGTTGMPKGVVWAHDDLFTTLGYPAYATLGLPIPSEPAEVGAGGGPDPRARRVARHAQRAAAHARHVAVPVDVDVPAGRHGRAAREPPLRRRRDAPARRSASASPSSSSSATPSPGRWRRPSSGPTPRAGPYDLSSLQADLSSGMMWSAPLKRPFLERGQMVLLDMLGRQRGRPVRGGHLDAGRRPGDGHVQDRRPLRGVRRGLEADPARLGQGRRARRERRRSARLPRRPRQVGGTYRTIDGVRYTIPGDYALRRRRRHAPPAGPRHRSASTPAARRSTPRRSRRRPSSTRPCSTSTPSASPTTAWARRSRSWWRPRPGEDLDADELIAWVKGRLAGYKAPRHVVVVDEMRRSGSGKADYRWARSRWPPTPSAPTPEPSIPSDTAGAFDGSAGHLPGRRQDRAHHRRVLRARRALRPRPGRRRRRPRAHRPQRRPARGGRRGLPGQGRQGHHRHRRRLGRRRRPAGRGRRRRPTTARSTCS